MVINICVVGLGYVGLPTGALLASKGMRVHGVDTNEVLIGRINSPSFSSFEPDLDALVRDVIKTGSLTASKSPTKAEVFVLAVPTPVKLDRSGADLEAIKLACNTISKYLVPGNLIILESTVPVGTSQLVYDWLCESRPDLKSRDSDVHSDNSNRIYVAHCPERVLPGRLLHELVKNDRTVGGIDNESARRAGSFYEKFVDGDITYTNAPTAELSKLVENAYRDVNIAFANELSMICDDLGIDVWDCIKQANKHPRVNILSPSSGVGGHCIAVDPWFIVSNSPKYTNLIRTAREVNDSKPNHVVKNIQIAVQNCNEPVLACLGLSFKPNVDDLRGSPALQIVERLAVNHNLNLLVVEPHIKKLPLSLSNLKNIKLVSLEEALTAANVVALLVNHDVFKKIRPNELMDKKIIDTSGTLRY